MAQTSGDGCFCCLHATGRRAAASGRQTSAIGRKRVLPWVRNRGKFNDVAQAAFLTRPARMQAAQTRICFLLPPTTARTRRRFGFQRRRRVLFAWLITLPKCGAFPQSSHFIAIALVPAQPKYVVASSQL